MFSSFLWFPWSNYAPLSLPPITWWRCIRHSKPSMIQPCPGLETRSLVLVITVGSRWGSVSNSAIKLAACLPPRPRPDPSPGIISHFAANFVGGALTKKEDINCTSPIVILPSYLFVLSFSSAISSQYHCNDHCLTLHSSRLRGEYVLGRMYPLPSFFKPLDGASSRNLSLTIRAGTALRSQAQTTWPEANNHRTTSIGSRQQISRGKVCIETTPTKWGRRRKGIIERDWPNKFRLQNPSYAGYLSNQLTTLFILHTM